MPPRKRGKRAAEPRAKQAPVSAVYAYESGEAGEGRGGARGARRPSAAEEDDDNDDDDEEMELPLGEGAPMEEQIGVMLDGSSDDEIILVLGQLPIANDLKLLIGMRKLSPAAAAFDLLRPIAEECAEEKLSFLFDRIGTIATSQLDADIAAFSDPANVAALQSHPPEGRRRLFFLSLAAGYVDTEDMSLG